MLIINLFHLLVIAPILAYVGYHKAASPDWLFISLIVLAAMAAVIHALRAYQKINK